MSVLLALLFAVSPQAVDPCHRALNAAEFAITSSDIDAAIYGDFDEDGRPDAALHLFGSDRVIALNRGSVFEPMPVERLTVGNGPLAAAAADLNRDGHLDLIYRLSNAVIVAPGRGNGTFLPQVTTPLSHYAYGYRLVDFDHDGTPDFVDFDALLGTFNFVRAKGDGTYEEVGFTQLQRTPFSSRNVTAGDFDGDGNIDVVRLALDTSTTPPSTEIVFGWNDGAFHFSEAGTKVVVPITLQPVDIDGDGAEDLVGIDNGELVIVRAKHRQITLQRIPVAPAGTSLTVNGAVMTDVDGDGIRDLVFSGPPFGIVYGTANNGFRDLTLYDTLSRSFTAVDLDGDGLVDFAANGIADYLANTLGSGLTVLRGAALRSGQVPAARIYPAGFSPARVDIADVDGDGHPDLVATTRPGEAFRAIALFGDGRGEFRRVSNPFTVPANYVTGQLFTGDFDGDGRADLAFAGNPSNGSKPMIAFGAADGFTGGTLTIDADAILGRVFPDRSSPPALIALKGDDVQLVTISSGRAATLSTVYHRPAGATVAVVRGTPDVPAQIAVITSNLATVVTRSADGWHEGWQFLVDSNAPVFAAADFNGDGIPDIAYFDFVIAVAMSSGSSFAIQKLSLPDIGDSIVPADIDGDGRVDLVVSAHGNPGDPEVVQLLRNNGSGFDLYGTFLSSGFTGVAAGDVDGDGLPDVVLPATAGVEVMKNVCDAGRVRVEALPFNPAEGTPVKLVIHALSTDAFAVGTIRVSEGSKVLTLQQPDRGEQFATIAWTSPPLSPGSHTFRIEYVDQYGGTSETSITVTTRSAVRRRALH